jgi:hypothetical protein
MSGRQTWVIGAAIVIGCLILGLFFGQPSAAQQKGGQQATGRYRAVLAAGRAGDRVLVVDTVTGRCWFKLTEDRIWKDLGSPVQ